MEPIKGLETDHQAEQSEELRDASSGDEDGD